MIFEWFQAPTIRTLSALTNRVHNWPEPSPKSKPENFTGLPTLCILGGSSMLGSWRGHLKLRVFSRGLPVSPNSVFHAAWRFSTSNYRIYEFFSTFRWFFLEFEARKWKFMNNNNFDIPEYFSDSYLEVLKIINHLFSICKLGNEIRYNKQLLKIFEKNYYCNICYDKKNAKAFLRSPDRLICGNSIYLRYHREKTEPHY